MLLISACSSTPPQDKTINLKSFFFPYENFFKPKIYKYVDKDNPDNIQYWFMETSVVTTDTILTTKAYNESLNQIELIREKTNSIGSTMLEFTMINDTIVTNSKATEIDVYHWHQPKDKKITWSVTYESQYGVESLSKTREFISSMSNKEFESNSYKTVKFKDTFKHSIKNKDWSDLYSFYQYSYYCQGLGMIEYERFLPDGKVIDYYLDKVLTEEEWNTLNKK